MTRLIRLVATWVALISTLIVATTTSTITRLTVLVVAGTLLVILAALDLAERASTPDHDRARRNASRHEDARIAALERALRDTP